MLHCARYAAVVLCRIIQLEFWTLQPNYIRNAMQICRKMVGLLNEIGQSRLHGYSVATAYAANLAAIVARISAFTVETVQPSHADIPQTGSTSTDTLWSTHSQNDLDLFQEYFDWTSFAEVSAPSQPLHGHLPQGGYITGTGWVSGGLEDMPWSFGSTY